MNNRQKGQKELQKEGEQEGEQENWTKKIWKWKTHTNTMIKKQHTKKSALRVLTSKFIKERGGHGFHTFCYLLHCLGRLCYSESSIKVYIVWSE